MRAGCSRPHGAVALAVVAILIALASLAAWQQHSRLQLEHRNMLEPAATDADWESARSAMEWTLAHLNATTRMSTCDASAGSTGRLRDIYLQRDGRPRHLGCRADGPTVCQCDDPQASASQSGKATRSIRVSVQAELSSGPQTWQVKAAHGNRQLSASIGAESLLYPLDPQPVCLPEAMAFRLPLKQWRHLPQVRSINCPVTEPCDTALASAVAEGWRLFHFPRGLTLLGQPGGTTVGSPEAPVLLAVEGEQRWPQGSTLHGLLWSVPADSSGNQTLQNLTVHGIAKTCGATAPTVWPAEKTTLRLAAEAAWFTWVPGSWSDPP